MFLLLPVFVVALGVHPLAQTVAPEDTKADSSPDPPPPMSPDGFDAGVRQQLDDFEAFNRDLLDKLERSSQQQRETSRRLAEEANARAREQSDEQLQRLQEYLEAMPARLAEEVERNLERRRSEATEQGLTSGQRATLLVSALVALFAYRVPFLLLVEPTRRRLVQVDAPDTLRRWRTQSGTGSLLALVSLVLVFLSHPAWWYLQLEATSPHVAVASLVLAIGLCIAAMVTLFRVHGLCIQRLDDLGAEALFATIAAGGTPGEPYVLYLRPFASTDAVKFQVRINYKSTVTAELEQVLATAARPIGRLITLGESLEHVGAGRIKSVNAEWQEAARRLIHHASLILLVPSSRPGTRWEIEHLLESGHIAKTVLLDVPNVRVGSSHFAQHLEWDAVGAVFAASGYQWPDDDPEGAVVFFGASRAPRLIEPLKVAELSDALGRVRALVDAAAVATAPNPVTINEPASPRHGGSSDSIAPLQDDVGYDPATSEQLASALYEDSLRESRPGARRALADRIERLHEDHGRDPAVRQWLAAALSAAASIEPDVETCRALADRIARLHDEHGHEPIVRDGLARALCSVSVIERDVRNRRVLADRLAQLHEAHGHEPGVRQWLARTLFNATVGETDPVRLEALADRIAQLHEAHGYEPWVRTDLANALLNAAVVDADAGRCRAVAERLSRLHEAHGQEPYVRGVLARALSRASVVAPNSAPRTEALDALERLVARYPDEAALAKELTHASRQRARHASGGGWLRSWRRRG